MRRLSHTLGTVLAVCLFIRVVAWLITPALPMLVVLTLLTAFTYRVMTGPRFKGVDRFLK